MEVNTTENKTLEQDYRDLAGLLSNIVDSLPIYFFVKDTGDNFRYVYSSPLMNQLYGRYHNDVVGKTDFDLFLDPVVAQSFRDMDEEVVKTGKMQRFVEQMIDPKGILRTMDTMKLLAPREDKPPYLVGISWDITKQRQVEEELHSYNKRLALACQAGKIYPWLWDLVNGTAELSLEENGQIKHVQITHASFTEKIIRITGRSMRILQPLSCGARSIPCDSVSLVVISRMSMYGWRRSVRSMRPIRTANRSARSESFGI